MGTMIDTGRELDLAVAAEVMGDDWILHWKDCDGGTGLEDFTYDVPKYSTDRTAWLDVVGKLEEMGLTVALRAYPSPAARMYDCLIWHEGGRSESGKATAELSFAEAVCLAALDAVRQKRGDQ